MANKESALVQQLNYRAAEVGQTGVLELEDIRKLRAFYDHTCLKCGKNPATSPDHVIPLSEGGENTLENLQLLCTNCNKQKGAKLGDYRNGKICRSRDKREKHNWDEIETDYVTEDCSLRDLAKRYDVSLSHIGMVASRESWEEKRRNYRNKIGTEVLKEIEARNVAENFSAYRATFVLVRKAFDDYVAFPHPDKLKAIDNILEKALAMEGKPTSNKQTILKNWQDVPQPNDTDDIQQFATKQAGLYYGGDSDGNREPRAGWTD